MKLILLDKWQLIEQKVAVEEEKKELKDEP